jgi:hypothetical protein
MCTNIAAPSATDLVSCEAEYFGRLGCQFATAVGSTFAQCDAHVAALPCGSSGDGGAEGADGGASPSSCRHGDHVRALIDSAISNQLIGDLVCRAELVRSRLEVEWRAWGR